MNIRSIAALASVPVILAVVIATYKPPREETAAQPPDYCSALRICS